MNGAFILFFSNPKNLFGGRGWGGEGRGGEEKLGLFNHDFSIFLEVHYELIIESILRLGFVS